MRQTNSKAARDRARQVRKIQSLIDDEKDRRDKASEKIASLRHQLNQVRGK